MFVFDILSNYSGCIQILVLCLATTCNPLPPSPRLGASVMLNRLGIISWSSEVKSCKYFERKCREMADNFHCSVPHTFPPLQSLPCPPLLLLLSVSSHSVAYWCGCFVESGGSSFLCNLYNKQYSTIFWKTAIFKKCENWIYNHHK